MKFWTQLRLAFRVIVAAIALVALLVTYLTAPASHLQQPRPVPPATNPADSLRAPGGTTGL